MLALTPSNNNLYTGIVAFLLFFLAVQFSQQHVEHSYEVIQSLVPLCWFLQRSQTLEASFCRPVIRDQLPCVCLQRTSRQLWQTNRLAFMSICHS